MTSNFGKDIAEWAQETHKWTNKTAAAKARFVYKEVVLQSPSAGLTKYSTGHFLHNWRLSSKAPVEIELSGTASVPTKTSEINSFIDDSYFQREEKVFFSNSTEYLDQVEYLGWQRTPPYAPVARAIAASIE